MHRFENIEYIDHGRFATVLKAVCKKTKKKVALKKLWIKSSIVNHKANNHATNQRKHSNMNILDTNQSFTSTYIDYLTHCAQREICILKHLSQYDNIVNLIDSFTSDEHAVLVLEHMEIDLHNLIRYNSYIFICFSFQT